MAAVATSLATEFMESEPTLTRPRTRGECADVPRPCPFASCRYSLLVEVRTSGFVVDVFGDRDVPPDFSCALDVAKQGGITLEQVGTPLGLTRERVRQIEAVALAKVLRHRGEFE